MTDPAWPRLLLPVLVFVVRALRRSAEPSERGPGGPGGSGPRIGCCAPGIVAVLSGPVAAFNRTCSAGAGTWRAFYLGPRGSHWTGTLPADPMSAPARCRFGLGAPVSILTGTGNSTRTGNSRAANR